MGSKSKKIAALALVAVIFLAIFFFTQVKPFKRSTTITVSPDILYLTSPVTNFSGVVDDIAGNTVTVSQTIYYQPYQMGITPPTPNNPSTGPITPISTSIVKKLTYRVTVGPNTQISRPEAMVIYLFPSPPAGGFPTSLTSPKLTISDIKKGQNITISTNTDLRTLADNRFTAVNIRLPPIVNTLTGKIVAIAGNTLTVKAREITYQVTVTANTEISRFNPMVTLPSPQQPAPHQPEKLSLTDLQPNMQITVYTNQDVTATQTLTALRIEPQLPPATP